MDRLKLAEALDAAAASMGTIQKILLQVNLAGEASKSGTSPEAAAELLREISQLPHLRVVGLMTMPPFLDPEAVRPYFRALRELRDRLQDLGGTPLPELSMGMSGDFEVAIEAGRHPGAGGHRHLRQPGFIVSAVKQSRLRVWPLELKILEDPLAFFSMISNFSSLSIFPISDMILLPKRLEGLRKYGRTGDGGKASCSGHRSPVSGP